MKKNNENVWHTNTDLGCDIKTILHSDRKMKTGKSYQGFLKLDQGASFIEILNNFECTEVIIKLADASRAGLVLPSEQPENQDVLMLMMPMLIND